jgi:O-antigen/teichoic acid export membrane protein
VELNLVTSAMATARGAGAVGVLVWISPTIEAFFLWQGLVSVATVLLFAGITRRALPASPLPARFSGVALRGIWNFAAGMMAITLLSLLLTQTDKILLSRLLSLKAYGYYALAGVVTNGLFMIVAPITGAFYPRFTELATAGKEAASRSAYHQGSQLVSVAMGSAAIMLILFRESVLLLWAGDPVLVSQVAPITAVLAFGVLLNGLMWMPYQMMLAHGWTSLTIRANIVAVTFLVPSILWVVPRYGAVGAAWLYAALNACSIVFTVQIMHLRLLSGEKWRWYGQDVAAPLGAAAVVALLCRWLIPLHLGKIAESVALAATSGLVLFSAGLAAPAVRTQLIHWFDSRKRLIHAN